ncbi:hypothetical protein FOMPIDRAFT_1055269 [Fomitopsis schrenkii]|uniref:Uncharacterized protein n=1 Tax=Fomitopsis schrenkii TaxID=2126942 RepID=S8DSQ6_FOMSC|nr:hypothetical protein FOMPIDRAFT_1055269 [Fomitopsis schrenkii]
MSLNHTRAHMQHGYELSANWSNHTSPIQTLSPEDERQVLIMMGLGSVHTS